MNCFCHWCGCLNALGNVNRHKLTTLVDSKEHCQYCALKFQSVAPPNFTPVVSSPKHPISFIHFIPQKPFWHNYRKRFCIASIISSLMFVPTSRHGVHDDVLSRDVWMSRDVTVWRVFMASRDSRCHLTSQSRVASLCNVDCHANVTLWCHLVPDNRCRHGRSDANGASFGGVPKQ